MPTYFPRSSAGTPPAAEFTARAPELGQHEQMALRAPLIETAGQNLQQG